MTDDKLLLLGCGILQKEVTFLIAKNNWPVETLFLDSVLHVELDKLAKSLTSALASHRTRKNIVFYGTCHPLMEQMLEDAATFRTSGQNCCEMLLGTRLFTEELAQGTYFLLEDWAKRWEQIMIKTFNTRNMTVIRDIFRGDRTCLLGLRTSCSTDFTTAAEEVGRMVGLPLRWQDVSLDHLEAVLRETIDRKLREAA